MPAVLQRDRAALGAGRGRHRRRQHQAGRDRRRARGARRRSSRASCRRIRSPAPRRAARARRSAELFRERARHPHAARRRRRRDALDACAAAWEACGARVVAHDARASTTRSSPRSATCRTCSPSRWCTRSPRATNAARAVRLRRGRLPRLHAHRRSSPGDVARHLRRQPRRAARRSSDAIAAQLDAIARAARARATARRSSSCSTRRARRATRWLERRLRSVLKTLELAAGRAAPRGTVRLPGSKSISNRTLLLAALARGRHRACSDLLDADDTRVMLEALRRSASRRPSRTPDACGDGRGGRVPGQAARELFLGNAGTAFRPLTAALAFARRRLPPLRRAAHARAADRRPGRCAARDRRAHRLSAATTAFRRCDSCRQRSRCGGRVRVRGDVSSQFLTRAADGAAAARARRRRIEVRRRADLASPTSRSRSN